MLSHLVHGTLTDEFRSQAVLSVEGDEDSFPRPAIQSSLNAAMGEMVANMKNKEYIKRKLWSIPFTIGERFVIGING